MDLTVPLNPYQLRHWKIFNFRALLIFQIFIGPDLSKLPVLRAAIWLMMSLFSCRISPDGVDIVLDCLCGENTGKGLTLLKPMGTYILYGWYKRMKSIYITLKWIKHFKDGKKKCIQNENSVIINQYDFPSSVDHKMWCFEECSCSYFPYEKHLVTGSCKALERTKNVPLWKRSTC